MYSPLKLTLMFLEPLSIEKKIALIDIAKLLKGQGIFCFFSLIVLPFCTPLMVPGLSTVFGLTVSFLAISRLYKRKLPWPASLEKVTLAKKHFLKLIAFGFKFEKILEKISRPRLKFFTHAPLCKTFHFVVIALAGLLLALPLPIPGSNMVFGWVILLTSVGHLMNDGLLILIGDLLLISILVAFSMVIY